MTYRYRWITAGLVVLTMTLPPGSGAWNRPIDQNEKAAVISNPGKFP